MYLNDSTAAHIWREETWPRATTEPPTWPEGTTWSEETWPRATTEAPTWPEGTTSSEETWPRATTEGSLTLTDGNPLCHLSSVFALIQTFMANEQLLIETTSAQNALNIYVSELGAIENLVRSAFRFLNSVDYDFPQLQNDPYCDKGMAKITFRLTIRKVNK